MYYIETTVLFAFTMGKASVPSRFKDSTKLFDRINKGEVNALTSFYALHEILILVIQKSENKYEGLKVGKAALEKIMSQKILVLPLLKSDEKINHAYKFSKIKDSSDIPHAISAYINEAEGIITYDTHFDDIAGIIDVLRPTDLLI